MAKKGSWFSALKKAFSLDSKKDQKTNKSKKKWFTKWKEFAPLPVSSVEETTLVAPSPPHPLPPPNVKLTEAENQQSKHAYSVALATAVAAEAAVAAAQASAKVVRLTSVPRFPEKSKEEVAVIKIQTAFCGYLARRGLRALRGLARLKSLIQGQSVKRQANSMLKCMQTLARVQPEVRARRIRMPKENQALQRQIQLKREKEADKNMMRAPIEEHWEGGIQSKEKLEANLHYRQEAAVRRERALAYSYSHQEYADLQAKGISCIWQGLIYLESCWGVSKVLYSQSSKLIYREKVNKLHFSRLVAEIGNFECCPGLIDRLPGQCLGSACTSVCCWPADWLYRLAGFCFKAGWLCR
ncbi:protein IQ-DOMAIN 2-like [Rutidosis leptorrhynchoides]|uniref:protein IQ-DOMAIN 2-like n=1 Tax=Rutidosis leptorrhynchoides TaxID=125765 RepID=UPI003A98EB4C